MDELMDQLHKYLAGQTSLSDFEYWLYALAWDVEQSASPDMIALVNRLEGLLAEASSASWPEDVLRQEIGKSIRPFAGISAKDPNGRRIA
jgi:hypothetical protein